MKKGTNPNRLTSSTYVVEVDKTVSASFNKLSEALLHVRDLDVNSDTTVDIVRKTTVVTTKLMRTFTAKSKTNLVESGEIVLEEYENLDSSLEQDKTKIA